MLGKLRFFILLLVIAIGSTSFDVRVISSVTILELVNKDRAAYGLPALTLNPTLTLAALSKAQDMLTHNYFSHVSPNGTKPWHWFKSLGYEYTYAGENLAAGFEDPFELERQWMDSPEHRANILSPLYHDVGLAIVEKENKTVIVQFFGSRASSLTLHR